MLKTMTVTVVVMALIIFAACGVGPPAAPTGLTVTSTAPITLGWNSELAATSYNVYRGQTSSTKSLLANITVTTFIDNTPPPPGPGSYYYHVTAVNWDRESAPSNEVNVTIP